MRAVYALLLLAAVSTSAHTPIRSPALADFLGDADNSTVDACVKNHRCANQDLCQIACVCLPALHPLAC